MLHRSPFLLLFLPVLAQGQTPTGFAVDSATSTRVVVSWTANEPRPAAYVVERKLLSGEFSALAVNPDSAVTTYEDTSIAPFETYVYRVRARLSPTSLSDPSAEFTVGPPPVGFTIASPLQPAVEGYALSDPSNFGTRLRGALDSNGDLAFAYLIHAPEENAEKSVIEFVSWNRAAYRWNAPRKVAVAGDALGSGPGHKSLALSRDATSNTWGVAWIKLGGSPRIAFSRDGGQNWTESQAFDCGELGCYQTALGMSDGKLHLAFLRATEGIRYVTGNLIEEPSAWKSEVVPVVSGGLEAIGSFDLALDNAGQPAIVFWSNTESYNLILGYWRPGAATVNVMDTNGYQTDAPDVDLKFFGARARILAEARRTEDYFDRWDRNYWVVRDLDGTFSSPMNLPADGQESLGYGSLAVSGTGTLSVTATEVGGSGSGVQCGRMKLLEQNLEAAAWTVCSPVARDNEPFANIAYPRVLYAPNDSRYIFFTNASTDSKLPGVLVWRER